MAKGIRKQVYELQPSDLEAFPGWEFATDEEAREGQDEATVRPLKGLIDPSSADGVAVVQAVFHFPNGRVRTGTVTVNAGDGLASQQPALVLEDQRIMFYFGVIEPRPAVLKRNSRLLRRVSSTIFPIWYEATFRRKDGSAYVRGRLDGFYQLANWKTGKLRVHKPS